ncbi:pectinesterase family protein [Marinoscillum sp. MHG1-6]|uniref:pectinesterase family protein n=1 Tax=Marinoscillum sp. MHG1-6 TaxID=2959627 RepID=UPI0021589832|nr:pectinesterase family protein [Marinoscillum sp. MHG1-6]
MRVVLILILLIGICLPTRAQVFDAIVAKDGTGNYTSIVQALKSRSVTQRLFIKNGVYEEKVSISATKDGISLIGESVDGVIIQWDDYSGDIDGHTTGTSYTLSVQADDYYMENITIKNTAGNVGQAVAIHTEGQRIAVKNCKFIGFQDTYYADGAGLVYNQNCYIEGATDFIFGDATAVFDSCEIRCVNGGQYITAPADTKLTSTDTDVNTVYHGLLFNGCNITSNNDVSADSYYLGRPWQPNASSVYINCTLGAHVKAEGWSIWNDNNHLSGTYAEYQSITPAGDLVDTTSRVDWSKQLTTDYANTYYNLTYFLTKNAQPWDYDAPGTALSSPGGLSMDGYGAEDKPVISWNSVTDAIGYAVLRDGVVEGFTDSTSFMGGVVTGSVEYSVKSVTESGALSGVSDILVVDEKEITLDNEKSMEQSWVIRKGSEVELLRRADALVYSLNGRLVQQEKNTQNFKLASNLHGVFVVKCIFDTKTEIFKILL